MVADEVLGAAGDVGEFRGGDVDTQTVVGRGEDVAEWTGPVFGCLPKQWSSVRRWRRDLLKFPFRQELLRRHDCERERTSKRCGQVKQIAIVRDEVVCTARSGGGQEQIVVGIATFGVPLSEIYRGAAVVGFESLMPRRYRFLVHVQHISEDTEVLLNQFVADDEL